MPSIHHSEHDLRVRLECSVDHRLRLEPIVKAGDNGPTRMREQFQRQAIAAYSWLAALYERQGSVERACDSAWRR